MRLGSGGTVRRCQACGRDTFPDLASVRRGYLAELIAQADGGAFPFHAPTHIPQRRLAALLRKHIEQETA